MRKLTTKQEAFAVASARGASYAQAYRASYDASKMRPANIQKEANKLERNPLVAGRIAELSAPAIEKAQDMVEVDLPTPRPIDVRPSRESHYHRADNQPSRVNLHVRFTIGRADPVRC